MKKMTISEAGISLIKEMEGCKLKAYKPVATEKHYTIGIGHYSADVTKDMVITNEKAEELFRKDIAPIEKLLNSLRVNFRQEQFDSLVSWIFNLGAGNFKNSTMLARIMDDKDDIEITDQMVRWTRSNNKVLPGLVRRRVAEANMWHGKTVYKCENNKAVKI